MFVPTAHGYLLNVQQITQIYVEQGEVIEFTGPRMIPGEDPEVYKELHGQFNREVGTDKNYATAYALAGGARHVLWEGYESKTNTYINRLFDALKKNGLFLDFETDDLL